MSEQLILASECDVANEVICAPADVKELFDLPTVFTIGDLAISRTIILIFLAAFIVVALLYFGLRKGSVIPSKFQSIMESLVQFVRKDIAQDIIGPEGVRYAPYLTAMFLFLLVGNLFEITPLINFPITSRMAIPAFLAAVTWVLFVGIGFYKNGFSYVSGMVWPKSVPIGLRWLVGIIELFSTFILRPLTLAVRLFANLVAGHLMLTLLLASGVIFIVNFGDAGLKSLVGVAWFAFGLGIFVFEIVVAVLQAYIFTLLSAVYIQSSIHPEH
jgi:F-type H+-transporting ATPase subunit a